MLERDISLAMAMSRSNSHNFHNSCSTRTPSRSNDPNETVSRKTLAVRSTEDLRDMINNNRQAELIPPAPPTDPSFQERVATLRQATALLTQLVNGLQGGLLAPPLGPNPSRRAKPSTCRSRTPEPHIDGEVNSPRPSEVGMSDKRWREHGTTRATKSALGHLSTRVSIRNRLDFGLLNGAHAEASHCVGLQAQSPVLYRGNNMHTHDYLLSASHTNFHTNTLKDIILFCMY